MDDAQAGSDLQRRQGETSFPNLLDFSKTQHYCCVMLPPLTEEGLLPPGVHVAEWDEIWAAFATSAKRQRLLNGFLRAIKSLKAAGCKVVYLDGSFVTAKEDPGDFDGCWDMTGVNPRLLDPILLKFEAKRLAQKVKFGGELFPAAWIADNNTMLTFLEFFQIEKETGNAKGIIAIDLERLTP